MLCRYYKSKIEKQMPALSEMSKKHLSNCSKCKAFYQSLIDTEKQLSESESSILFAVQVKKIESQILQNLDAQTDAHNMNADFTSSKKVSVRFTALAAAAVFIAAALIAMYFNNLKPEGPAVDAALIAQIADDSNKLQSQIIQFAKLPEISIQNEMTNLTKDIKSTLIFLQNCTPISPLENINKTEQN